MDNVKLEQGVGLVVGAAESLIPGLAPFHPLIALVATAIMAHFNATKTWPTEEQIRAALPVDYAKLVDIWAAWKPSGDGSLAPKTT